MCNQDDCSRVGCGRSFSLQSSGRVWGNISLLSVIQFESTEPFPIMEMKGVGTCCCPLFDKFLSELWNKFCIHKTSCWMFMCRFMQPCRCEETFLEPTACFSQRVEWRNRTGCRESDVCVWCWIFSQWHIKCLGRLNLNVFGRRHNLIPAVDILNTHFSKD